MLKVCSFVRDRGGCALLRARQPFVKGHLNKALEATFIEKGDDAESIGQKIDWADVLLVPRLGEGIFIHALEGYRKLGKKLVIDWDDDIFNVSPLSPAYVDFGTENYSHATGDGKLDVWVDKVNGFEIERNKEHLGKARAALRMCDMVTCTTDILGKIFQDFNQNVKALPNSVDMGLWKKLPLQAHKGLRMGWFGGWSHYEDWLIMAGILPEFMRQHPDITLVILGTKFDGTLKDVDPKRIEFHSWVEIDAYPYKAATLDLDFAVIPLVDNEFNNSKSAIKWLEMSSLQIPSVTSYVSPYAEMMDMVKDNGIFIEGNSTNGWWGGMNLLATDLHARRRIGTAAYQTVERHFDANKTYVQWVEAYEELVSKKLEVV